MSNADERPGNVAARQRRALGRYLRNEVMRYSPYNRARLESAAPNGRPDSALGRVEPVRLADVDAATVVMAPGVDEVRRLGPAVERVMLTAEGAVRGSAGASARVDPVYKPIHWHVADGVLIANTARDLDLLGELGRQILERAGVKPADRVLNLLDPGPTRDYWQVVLGCQAGGVSALHGWPPGAALRLDDAGISVLIASPARAKAVLEAQPHSLHTVLAVGEMYNHQRQDLERLAAPGAVVHAHSPPAVRTLWSEQRGTRGLRVFPGHELVEVVDGDGHDALDHAEGQIVWTPIGWRGTVAVRLDTGARGRARRLSGVVSVVELVPASGEVASPPDEPDEADRMDEPDRIDEPEGMGEPAEVPQPATRASATRARTVPTRTVPTRTVPTRKVPRPRPARRAGG